MADEDQLGLRHGPLDARCAHLCVDMQKLFDEGSAWETPWLQRVLPVVQRLAGAHPDRCIFTRFLPVAHPGEGRGTWRRYYQHWYGMTLEALPPDAIDLVEPLQRFVPPAVVIDKEVYSPWVDTSLDDMLRQRDVDSLIISGAETDVCVLAAVLGAVDRGYRVVVPVDAICSSSDVSHDALLALYSHRFRHQVETASTDEILAHWH